MTFPCLSKQRTVLPALLLLVWAVLLRFQIFNDPVFYIDEDFYLYLGRELLQGYLPYVDLWDRKPFGLFLLYAPFALFGEYRFLAYQIGALAFAWGTALFILKTTQIFASMLTSLLAAGFYLALIGCLGGAGGQTPVLYNFFTAFAFYLVICHFKEIKISPKQLSRTGIGAMLLIGIAIEIKPTVIFEGLFLGAFLLFITWRSQQSFKNLCLNGFYWILAAFLPTLLIVGFYIAIGHFDAWYFANIISIFQKKPYTPLERFYPYLGLFAGFLLALIILRYTALDKFRSQERKYFYFLLCWTVTALIATCLLRPFYSFYLLPFCLPFALFVGIAASHHKGAQYLLAASVLGIAVNSEFIIFGLINRHPVAEYNDIQNLVSQQPNACLFEYGASVAMLDLTPEMATNCHLTKYLFPSHLGNPDEEGALGIEKETSELKHILDQNPTFILVGHHYLEADKDQRYQDVSSFLKQKTEMIKEKLSQNYHLIYEHTKDETLKLYELNKTF